MREILRKQRRAEGKKNEGMEERKKDKEEGS